VDDATWTIRYLVVDPSRWKLHDEVVLAPSFVERVSWGERCLRVRLTQDKVRTAPHYAGLKAVTPEYEAALARHYASP
jgi:hypothetical protein